jgi:hypothetical protein
VYLVNRRLGKPKTQVQVDNNITRSFVLRAPTVLSSAELWEQKYGLPEAIDVTPAKVEQSPHEVYQAAEPVAVVNEPAPAPVPSGRQGHLNPFATDRSW